jgi:PucR C-terminal helix-turn-helix domain
VEAHSSVTNSQLVHLVPSLVESMPELLDELEKDFGDLAAGYSTFLAERRDVVLAAAEAAVRSLVQVADQILSGNERAVHLWESEVDRCLFAEIGRIQSQDGVPVATLLSAYQIGARVTWRQLSKRAVADGVSSDALAALAESVFCFVDQLSSASTAGYLAEQAEAAAVRERSRDELVELLLSDRSDTAAVRAAAQRAGWPVPHTAAVVFVEPQNQVGRAIVSRLDQSCLPVRQAGLLGAIVPDPAAPGHRQRLATHLRGSAAVVGHTVTLEQLPASARIAQVAARLQQESVLAEDPVFVDEHLDTIIVHREPKLLEALRRQCLAPLEHAPPSSREALRDTLRSWLRNGGDRGAIAAELHVHPQTIRYRLARLRELFGAVLDEPDARMKLTLVLAWDHLC